MKSSDDSEKVILNSAITYFQTITYEISNRNKGSDMFVGNIFVLLKYINHPVVGISQPWTSVLTS